MALVIILQEIRMKMRKIKLRTLLLIFLIFFALVLVLLVALLFGNMFSMSFEMEFIRPHHAMSEMVELIDVNDLLLRMGIKAVGFALLVAIGGAIAISKFLSKDIVKSTNLAKGIVDGNFHPTTSRIVELDNLNDSLVDINTRLGLKNQNRKSIYDQLYHQSLTPIAIIKNILEGVEDGVVEMDEQEIKACKVQLENLQELIDNMGLIVEGQIYENVMKIETFEMGQLIRKIVNGYRTSFEKKKIKIEMGPESNVMVESDRFKISQAIYSLVSNALKYSDPGSSVAIEYYSENDNVVIKIKDHGRGIKKEELKHVFKAYYRGSDVQEIPGQGIGLYLVRQNIESCLGQVTIESDLNEGTIVTIILPLHYKKD